MPYTNCRAHMEFIDTSAISDSAAASADNASVGSLVLLKEKADYPDYMIPDLNNILLDGGAVVLEEESRLPFVSDTVSGDDCDFEDRPALTINFTSKHTSAGITLCFIGDYPSQVKIAWYELTGEKIIEKTFRPDALQYFCREQVENYGKVIITFEKTRLPGQRVKLSYVLYGTQIKWTDGDIQSASMTEEVDSTSATIPIGTCDIAIVDEDNDFELSNQNGMWKSIQKRQQISITEETATRDIPCGAFYIETWKSSGNVVSFSLIDLIGLIDKTKFYGGKVYDGETAGVVIAAIMSSAGVKECTVADDVAAIPLYGHIPICTHREALQQVVFACGAVASCNRQGGIDIRMPDRYADSTIGTDRKFMGTTIEMDDYVSGISISYKSYSLQSEASEVYKDTLPAGTSVIELSEPYAPDTLSATGGAIVEASTNYVKITMAEAGSCTITGKKYDSNTLTYTAHVDIIEAGEEENVLSYDGCTLFNADRVRDVARRLLNYYQLRQIVSMDYLAESERTGDWVNIRDAGGGIVTTGICQQTIDLTGGYIATAKCRGYSKITTAYAYAGEFYAGERGLI